MPPSQADDRIRRGVARINTVLGTTQSRLVRVDRAGMIVDIDATRLVADVLAPADGPGAERVTAGQAFRGGRPAPAGGLDSAEQVGREPTGSPTAHAVAAVPGRLAAVTREGDWMKAVRFVLHRALHEPLTALPNEVLLGDRLTQALALCGREGGTVAVLCVNLDGFEYIYQTHGSGLADALLVEVAHRLRSAVRAVDTVARTGGDEFTLVTRPMASLADVHVVRRILDRIQQPWTVGGIDLSPAATVGIAIADDCAGTDDLLREARSALEEANRSQRGR